jgi:hypothetical protein
MNDYLNKNYNSYKRLIRFLRVEKELKENEKASTKKINSNKPISKGIKGN